MIGGAAGDFRRWIPACAGMTEGVKLECGCPADQLPGAQDARNEEMGIESLRRAGCRTVYRDGGFETSKEIPNDFDSCWGEVGVEPELLEPVLLGFDACRAEQKLRYLGKLFPASIGTAVDGISFPEFSQTERATGRTKGIYAVDLGSRDDQERTAVPVIRYTGRANRAHLGASPRETRGSGRDSSHDRAGPGRCGQQPAGRPGGRAP